MSDAPVEDINGPAEVTLAELLADYDVLSVGEETIVVAERSGNSSMAFRDDTGKPDMSEIGGTGSSMWGNYLREEYNPELRGNLGLQIYDKMRRGDGQIRMALRTVKTPVLAARWYVDPSSPSKRDVKIAEELSKNLFRDMTASWPLLLTEALNFLDFGWYAFEKVWAIRDDKVVLRKLAPRHPLDFEEWEEDEHGGPTSMRFYAPNGAAESVSIPIEKMVVFTFDKEAGNMEGISILRSAYKHWYFKEQLYKIDAIQKERHGIGIPVIKLPPGFSPSDKTKAEELGRNLRTNEKAHIVLPPMWDIAMLKLEGQPVDCMTSIEHHNKMILSNILASFMGEDGDSGESKQDMFLKGTRFIADIIRDAFNKWVFPELVRYNYGPNVEPPELKVRRIGETVDWRTLSFTLRNLVGAKIITVDEKLEDWIRDEVDAPRRDPNSVREVETPQSPEGARVGPPRQSKAANMEQQAQGTGKANAGTDTSGG